MTAIVPHMSMVWHSLPSAHVPVGHVLPSLHNPSSPTVAETSAKVASGLVAQMVAGVGSLGRQMSAEQMRPNAEIASKAMRLRMNQMMYRIMLIISRINHAGDGEQHIGAAGDERALPAAIHIEREDHAQV